MPLSIQRVIDVTLIKKKSNFGKTISWIRATCINKNI